MEFGLELGAKLLIAVVLSFSYCFVMFITLKATLLLVLKLFSYYLFQICNFLFFFGANALERCQLIKLFCLVLFSLHRLAHTIRNTRFIKCLIGQYSHFYFVSYSNKQKSSFCAVYCCLAYKFIKGLRVEVFTDRTYTCLSSLSFLEFLVQFLLQNHNVESRRRDRRDILEPQLAIFFVLIGGQYRVQVVFCLTLFC